MAIEAVNSTAEPPKPPTPPARRSPPLVDDDKFSQDNYRRKRTKRSTPPLPSAREDEDQNPGSPKDPLDDHHLARILVMLARSGQRDLPSTSAADSTTSGEKKNIQDSQETEPPRAGTHLHECNVCQKTFKSHQALGGHKASHRKYGPTAAVSEVENRPSTSSAAAKIPTIPAPNPLNPNGKPHVCKICYMSFSSGQALGGHQRRHYVSPGDGQLGGRQASNDVPNPSPTAKVGPTLTVTVTRTASASGVTSSEGGASTHTPGKIDLNQLPDLELRLGSNADPAPAKKSQTFDDHEVESPMPSKTPCLLFGSLLSL